MLSQTSGGHDNDPSREISGRGESAKLRVAEFFAGIGLVRLALEPRGFRVVWANDIDQSKFEMYRRNFNAPDFALDDIRNLSGGDIPEIDLATASFPCTDLSLAGTRTGLNGSQSRMFWEFARILQEMHSRKPAAILLENVPSFATSNNGEDLRLAVEHLNSLGYRCDLLVINARHFVPQSRPRLFIIGSQQELSSHDHAPSDQLRPPWIRDFMLRNHSLAFNVTPLRLPDESTTTLADVVEHIDASDARWWDAQRSEKFVQQLSLIQLERFRALTSRPALSWSTAYRRTRNRKPAWEIRADSISGALRTARGGSSKQALVEAGLDEARLRWMTAREYARLQGAPDYDIEGVPENRAMFGFGDAVCVPVVSWLADAYLSPLLAGSDVGFIDGPSSYAKRELINASE